LALVTELTIYVELLGEGVVVWRPVVARREADGTYRLPGKAPEGERWAFPPGARVRCEDAAIADSYELVARELVE
jgi:hypothetical protein